MSRTLAPFPGDENGPTSRAASILRHVRHVLVFVLGAVAAGISATYLAPVLAESRAVAAAEDRAASELRTLEDAARAEAEKLQWMRFDRAYLEQQARDRLNLQAPGETIIRFQKPGPQG